MDVSKVEQQSYVKITSLHGRNVCECSAELQKALGNRALPYQTVVHWVESFECGRVATVDLQCSGRPESAHTEVKVAVIKHCLTDERCWTVVELSTHSGTSAWTVFCILWKDLKMHMLCANWMPHALGEVQKMDSIQDMPY